MRLRTSDWRPVFNSSGARGFFGEGYWYHRFWRSFGLDYTGSNFVAKTTTLYARAGNMPLDATQRPTEWKPKCIVVKPFKGVVLNSVGLSGPGADFLIEQWSNPEKLPSRNGQWMISYMSVAKDAEDRLIEAKKFLEKFPRVIRSNGVMNLGLQINLSCPNVGLDVSKLVDEAKSTLDLTKDLGVPVLLKLNALVPVEAALEMGRHPCLDGLIMSNSIPWGKLPKDIPWENLFGSEISPLAHMGGGGLSGAPLLKIVSRWTLDAKKRGFQKPIIGGGGVLSVDDASYMLDHGADAIELGSVSILRPWRVKRIIDYINIRLGYDL